MDGYTTTIMIIIVDLIMLMLCKLVYVFTVHFFFFALFFVALLKVFVCSLTFSGSVCKIVHFSFLFFLLQFSLLCKVVEIV